MDYWSSTVTICDFSFYLFLWVYLSHGVWNTRSLFMFRVRVLNCTTTRSALLFHRRLPWHPSVTQIVQCKNVWSMKRTCGCVVRQVCSVGLLIRQRTRLSFPLKKRVLICAVQVIRQTLLLGRMTATPSSHHRAKKLNLHTSSSFRLIQKRLHHMSVM